MVVEQRSWVLTGATVAFVAALYLPCTQKAVPGGDSGKAFELVRQPIVYGL